ncbi:MAG: LexA family protein [Candidatus Alectryocaccobium sp.]|jgi:repressor LexA
MASFGERLKYLRLKKELSQDELAKIFGVSKQAISQYERGLRTPKDYEQIADFFNVDLDYLMGRSDFYTRLVYAPESYINEETFPSSVSTFKIPLYSAVVSAGNGAFADGNIETYIDIPVEMAKKGEYFGLRIKGDSMEPEIKNNDIVVVRKNPDPKNGQTIIAVVNGDEGFCKRIERYSNALGLISNNPEYRPMIFTPEEVENLPVRILGTVERLIRDF